MLKALVTDAQSSQSAKVSPYGELITGNIEYSSPSVQAMDTANTAYMLVEPVAGKKIVITGVVLSADRNVSSTVEATIDIYCADAPDTTTIAGDIIEVDLLKQQQLSINPLSIITDEGVWVNGKTTDAGVKVTLFYYYVEAI